MHASNLSPGCSGGNEASRIAVLEFKTSIADDRQAPGGHISCHDPRDIFVNKTELIDQIANDADISKASATRALDAALAAIAANLKMGGSVSIVGFGTFEVGQRAARSGRNPRTGESIKIQEAKVPKFRAGKALKDALN
jgi:DNA-binding protein HU-beta